MTTLGDKLYTLERKYVNDPEYLWRAVGIGVMKLEEIEHELKIYESANINIELEYRIVELTVTDFRKSKYR